jgi:hypothetical protein
VAWIPINNDKSYLSASSLLAKKHAPFISKKQLLYLNEYLPYTLTMVRVMLTKLKLIQIQENLELNQTLLRIKQKLPRIEKKTNSKKIKPFQKIQEKLSQKKIQ